MTASTIVSAQSSQSSGPRHSGIRIGLFLALAAVSLTLLALYFVILKLNHGTFVYTLDDPYITMAVGDQIRHGWYGIRPGEHSSPVSSILTPFLLAPVSGTPISPVFPLLLNSLALLLTIYILHRFASHLRLFPQTRWGIVAEAITLYCVAICLNLIAVVFTGMEHSMHIAVTAACIFGLVLFLDKGRVPPWLPLVLIASPLLRYEGLALSIAVLFVFAVRGKWPTAVACFSGIVFCLVSFSVFLVSMGLPPMPSSILTKSTVVAQGVMGTKLAALSAVGLNALVMLFHPVGFLLYAAWIAAMVLCRGEWLGHKRLWSVRGFMSFVLVCLIGAHAFVGRMGWLFRYEDYLLLGTLMAVAYLFQAQIRDAFARGNGLVWQPIAALALLAGCFPYIKNTIDTPIAANNIYEQQYQMGRFVRDYWRAPVAVGDLGLVCFRNPNNVLDLGGLASEQARTMIQQGADADAYRDLVSHAGMRLAIVYDEALPGRIPHSWAKVASMNLSRRKLSAAGSQVQFYATDAAAIPILRAELASFKESLPPEVKLTLRDGLPVVKAP